MQHLLDWQFLSDAQWQSAIERALHFAQNRKPESLLKGKNIGLLFFNSSLRTRTSMELAAHELGAFTSVLNVGQGTWGFAFGNEPMLGGEAEHIEEAIGVLSRYYDALGVRLFAAFNNYDVDKSEEKMRAIISAATKPVVNLESAFYHPCQALADAATITQQFGGNPKGKKFVLTWAPHPKSLPMAVPNSALLQAARLGMEVVVARPDTHALDADLMALAASYGAKVSETANQAEAFEGADVIYAKAWGGALSYTNPTMEEYFRRQNGDWTVTADKMSMTREAAFMHCLPVRRDVVVDTAVLKSAQAIHLTQAEYRLHAQKAILELLFKD